MAHVDGGGVVCGVGRLSCVGYDIEAVCVEWWAVQQLANADARPRGQPNASAVQSRFAHQEMRPG